MVGERIRERLDREPVWRSVDERVAKRTHKLRNRPGQAVKSITPEFQERNFGGGKGLGILEAAVIVVLEDTVGLPFGADADVSGINKTEDGRTLYTINVNAPSQNIAEARAFIDAGTGFTSVLTDKLDVRDVELISTRALRDTYQIEVAIKG